MELKEYAQVILRRKLIVVLGTVCVVATFLAMNLFSGGIRKYSANATLSIRNEIPRNLANLLELNPYLSSGYTYGTKEVLIHGKKVYRFGAVISLYAEKHREGALPDRIDGFLESALKKSGYLDGDGDLIITEELDQRMEKLRGSIRHHPPKDKIQLLEITASAQTAEEAIHLANAYGLGAQLYSRIEGFRMVKAALNNMALRVEQIQKNEMLGLLKNGLINPNEHDNQRQEINRLQKEIDGYNLRLETLHTERRKVLTTMEQISRRQHLQRMPIPKELSDAVVDSQLSSTLRADITNSRAEMTVQGTLRWHATHPRMKELERRIAGLELELDRELDRLRSVELSRLKNHEGEIQVEISEVGMWKSGKVFRLDRLSTFVNADRLRVDEYRRLEQERDELLMAKDKLKTVTYLQQPFYELYERAKKPSAEPTPSFKLQEFVLWGVLGIVLSFGLAFLLEYWDTNLYTDYDVRRYLNMPTVGVIKEEAQESSPLLLHLSSQAELSQLFSMASTVIRTHMQDREYKTLAICSAIKGEGKSTVATNLAICLARKGLRVALVDADLYRAQLNSWFGIDATHDLGAYLRDAQSRDVDVQQYIQPTTEPNLWLLPCGSGSSSASGFLESEAMLKLIRDLRENFDMVLFDTPPIIRVSDTLALSTKVDTNLLVVGSGISDRRNATLAKQLLSNVNADLCGALLNMARPGRGGSYYYYYGSYGYGAEAYKSVREG